MSIRRDTQNYVVGFFVVLCLLLVLIVVLCGGGFWLLLVGLLLLAPEWVVPILIGLWIGERAGRRHHG